MDSVKKNIKKHLPSSNLVLAQGRVDPILKKKTKRKMSKLGHSWRDLFEAAMKAYLDEE